MSLRNFHHDRPFLPTVKIMPAAPISPHAPAPAMDGERSRTDIRPETPRAVETKSDIETIADGRFSRAEVKARFEAADVSGDGQLQQGELFNLLRDMKIIGASQTDEALEYESLLRDYFLEQHDTDGDGELTIDELKAYVMANPWVMQCKGMLFTPG